MRSSWSACENAEASPQAAAVSATLLKKQVAQSSQRVRHELGLFLLRHLKDDVYKALRDQRSEIGSVRTTCGDPLVYHVDDRTVQALVSFLLRPARYFIFGHHCSLRQLAQSVAPYTPKPARSSLARSKGPTDELRPRGVAAG